MRVFEITIASIQIRVNGGYRTYRIHADNYADALTKLPTDITRYVIKNTSEVIVSPVSDKICPVCGECMVDFGSEWCGEEEGKGGVIRGIDKCEHCGKRIAWELTGM